VFSSQRHLYLQSAAPSSTVQRDDRFERVKRLGQNEDVRRTVLAGVVLEDEGHVPRHRGGQLRALVGAVDEPCPGLAAADRHLERLDDDSARMCSAIGQPTSRRLKQSSTTAR
jgi:hypothetical protein